MKKGDSEFTNELEHQTKLELLVENGSTKSEESDVKIQCKVDVMQIRM